MINGKEKPLSKVFNSDYCFEIPNYQRPYAWKDTQTTELYDDLYSSFLSNSDEIYFLGSIVLIKNENEALAKVIDGQQRLTTLTILLSVIYDQMQDLKGRSVINRYICDPGNVIEQIQTRPRLKLRDRDNDFFRNYIQEFKLDELAELDEKTLDNEAKQNIKKNARILRNRVLDSFQGNEQELLRFSQFVMTKCYLVVVSTTSQKSAFRVFAVMNSRGLNLQPTDIVKAEVIGAIDADRRIEYNERWEDTEVLVGREGFNDLFTYIRMINAKDKAKTGILEEIRRHILSKYSPVQLVENIVEPYGELLSIVKHSGYQAVAHSETVNYYLTWLNRLDNSDWIPPSLLFLKMYRHNPELVSKFFIGLERLAACLHLRARNVNHRISRYSGVLKVIQNSSAEEALQSLELTEEEKLEFIEVLEDEVYRITPVRRTYLILRLDSFIADGGATYDSRILTIEHVLPQTVNPGSKWMKDWPTDSVREYWTHRLANLVPLNFKKNAQASNFDFDRKKNEYFKGEEGVSSYALTSQVLNESTWTEEVLIRRQNNLLRVLKDKWSLN